MTVFNIEQMPVPMKKECLAALEVVECHLLDLYRDASAFEVEQHLREHLIVRQGKS